VIKHGQCAYRLTRSSDMVQRSRRQIEHPNFMSNRKSRLIGLPGLGTLLALAVLGGCASREPPAQPSFYRSLAAGGAELDASAAQSMISGYRQNNGLSAVELDPVLMQMAQEQARSMAARDKLDRAAGRSFTEHLKASGFDARSAAENVGAGYHTLAEAFSGWRDSPTHRSNMLLPAATRMGIAAVYTPGSKYKVFWSLILAAPDEKRG
jgi:uncharacterized protein YkwD